MHREEHDITWEQEWLEGTISKEEAISRAGEVDDIAILLKSTEIISTFKVKPHLPQHVVWEMLEEKILATSKTPIIGRSRRHWIRGIAASFILIVAALFILPLSKEQVFDTASAESNTIMLPAGSAVYLNANSSLSYNEDAWQEERLVTLQGEAFFEVTKGNRFIVSTDYGTVEVLGTSFNVRIRNQRLEVSCKTGRVRVSIPDSNSSQIITPGQKVVAKAGVVHEPVQIGIDQVGNWLDGEYDFEAVLLTEVLEEFERQYSIQLKYDKDDPNIKDRIYNGYFSNQNLNEAVQLICNPMGLSYEISENVVKIFSTKE